MHPPPLLVLEFFLGLLIFSLPADCDPTKAIHFTLSRRGGQFAPNRTANLDFLVQELAAAESKFNLTQREVRGNKIVRSPKSQAVGGAENSKLLGELGRHGNWYEVHQEDCKLILIYGLGLLLFGWEALDSLSTQI